MLATTVMTEGDIEVLEEDETVVEETNGAVLCDTSLDRVVDTRIDEPDALGVPGVFGESGD
jgi:hypothetical protein